MNPFTAVLQLAAMVLGAVLGSVIVGYVAYRTIRKGTRK